MARIFQFPHHRLVGVDVPCKCHERADGGWYCPFCVGGLALCVTCGGAEASLPSDCPGVLMEEVVQDAVQAGEVDYDRREGWVLRPSGLASFCRRG